MTARDVAIAVLADSRTARQTAKHSLDEQLGRYRIAPVDAGLAAELVWGVMRHRLTLECVLKSVIEDRWKRTSATLQNILLVAAYQMLWLDGVPEFAIINEAVEQAKREGGRPAGGFVNAVLRNVQRKIRNRFETGEPADPQLCIVTGTDRHCRFDGPILPNPQTEYAYYLSAATSHPEPLIHRWLKAYGEEATASICRANTTHPPAVLRPNALRTDATRLAERLRTDGCDVQIIEDQAVAVLQPAGIGTVLKLPAFAEGLFQPQDVTAMQPVRALDLKPGGTLIDLCAGLGTKATQAAERMNDRGIVLAGDTDAAKLYRLQDNCNRLGIQSVRTVTADEIHTAASEIERIDAILVDAPCSNSGVYARRPEARYRFHERSLQGLVGIQTELLEQAAGLARTETRICYSTCSIEPEENVRVVEAFCRRNPKWRVLTEHQALPRYSSMPADWRDGGYYAVLTRFE